MGLEVTGRYRYPSPDEVWLRLSREAVISPDQPIIDPHHHLWVENGAPYLLDQLLHDVEDGHRILATVFVQAHYGYRTTGPAHLAPVGETEKVAAMARDAKARGVATQVAAAIVAHADLLLGEAVDEVLDAHAEAADGRLRGVRHSVSRDELFPDGVVLRPAPAGLLADTRYRAGLSRLKAHGLVYEAMLYHRQIPELTALAQAMPDLSIVLDHCGCILGVGPYEGHEQETFRRWAYDLAALARCPNVRIKIGGFGMIVCGPRWHERPSPPSSTELADVWRPHVQTCIDLFGPDRCMFESNFPVDKAMYSYRTLWNAFKHLSEDLQADERDALFFRTAADTYGLPAFARVANPPHCPPMSNRAADLFRRVAERPDATAIIFDDFRTTFAILAAQVRHRAGALTALDIRRNDRVGLWLPSTPDFISTQQALFMLGAVVTPINVLYLADDVRHAAACCQLNAIVTTRALAAAFGNNAPCSLIVIDAAADKAGARSLPLAAATAKPVLAMADIADDDVAMLLLTSATTGKAKGVMLTAGNLAANYDRTPGWLGLDPQSVILCALPLYNTFGLNQGINAMLRMGCTLVLLSRFDAKACIAAIAKYRCSFLPAVPTMLQKILDHPDASRKTLGSLRTIMTGGAPVPSTLLRRLLELAPDVELLTGYGLTEATALVTLTPVRLNDDGGIDRERTIGRVLEGIELAVVDDAGTHLPTGGTGEMVVRGPNVMAGYFRSPEDNAAALTDGWLRTGDIGYVDPAGYVFIVDRKKDVIIRGGQNIYPADIEEVLYAFPGVAEAAVIGVPDTILGEVPIAFVALRNDRHAATVEEMIDHCRTRLSSYKRPVTIAIRDELPKGPTGKILRRALRPTPLPA